MTVTITATDVARDYLHHPDPESRAAHEQVRRLVRLGMPAVQCVRPWLYLPDQVTAWLAARAAGPPPRVALPARPNRRPRKRPTDVSTSAPIQARLEQLRNERRMS